MTYVYLLTGAAACTAAVAGAAVALYRRHFLAAEPAGLGTVADADAYVSDLHDPPTSTLPALNTREWSDADYANAFSEVGTYLDGFLSRRLPLVLPGDFLSEVNMHAFRTAEREAVAV